MSLSREQLDELLWSLRQDSLTHLQLAERHTRICNHDAEQRQDLRSCREALHHYIYRNHDYKPSGCEGCRQVEQVLKEMEQAQKY